MPKKNPARLNYGSGGNGSAGHLAGEMFKTQAGLFMVHIPYAGGPPAQLALLSGQVDLNFDNLAAASANIKSGKLRALAVTTAKRSSAMPDVPTIAESGRDLGLADFDIHTWFGLFGPARLPADVTARLNRAFVDALNSAEIKSRLAHADGRTRADHARGLCAVRARRARKVRGGRQAHGREGRLTSELAVPNRRACTFVPSAGQRLRRPGLATMDASPDLASRCLSFAVQMKVTIAKGGAARARWPRIWPPAWPPGPGRDAGRCRSPAVDHRWLRRRAAYGLRSTAIVGRSGDPRSVCARRKAFHIPCSTRRAAFTASTSPAP